MKITCLIENTPSQTDNNLFFEHGLSLHISFKGYSILFDMGKSDNFIVNALRLGIDISKCDIALLSHHHYDHGGGLDRFLFVNQIAPVYLKPYPFVEYYSHYFGKKLKYIGLNTKLLSAKQDRLNYVSDLTEIKPGIFIITTIETSFPKPKGNRYLFINQNGQLKPDDFDHELLLVIKENDGLVVFTGCAHNGILNMIKTVKTMFPNDVIKSIIGGFHLITMPFLNITAENKKSLKLIATKINGYNVGKIYTGHCTGDKAFRFLKKHIHQNFYHIATGDTLNV